MALSNFNLYQKSNSFSEYERLVLNLKSGDQVKFGPKVMTLGKFLGAGNATHIFQLQDEPGKVIRIPFVVSFNKIDFSPGELLDIYKNSEPVGLKNHSRILDKKNKGYVISEHIDGAIDYEKPIEQLGNSSNIINLLLMNSRLL